MKAMVVFALLFVNVQGFTQHRFTFSSRNYVGLLEGEHGSKFQVQTINGVTYNTWFAGVGTGVDWYYRRSIPLFLAVDKDLLKKGNTNLYVAAGGGLNFPWRDDKYYEYLYSIQETPPGVYWQAGVGYRIGLGKSSNAVSVELGYSYKHIREEVKNIYFFSDPPPGPEALANRFDYDLRRLSLKAGWSF